MTFVSGSAERRLGVVHLLKDIWRLKDGSSWILHQAASGVIKQMHHGAMGLVESPKNVPPWKDNPGSMKDFRLVSLLGFVC